MFSGQILETFRNYFEIDWPLQRARLHFTETDTDLKVDQFVTGIVCGILGCMNKNESSDGGGKFRVKKIFMPDHPTQSPAQKLTSEPQIAFISG